MDRTELARYPCTGAVEQSDNKRSRGKLSHFYLDAGTIFIPPPQPSSASCCVFFSFSFSLDAFIYPSSLRRSPELALASGGSSRRVGSAMVLYFLDKVTAPLSQQTTHPPQLDLLCSLAKRVSIVLASC